MKRMLAIIMLLVMSAIMLTGDTVSEAGVSVMDAGPGCFTVTAYCPCFECCGKTDGITATGTVAAEGRTVAVDPDVIPYGTTVFIYYENVLVGKYIAEDCGGAIKGNKLDIYFDRHEDALIWGKKSCEVVVFDGKG